MFAGATFPRQKCSHATHDECRQHRGKSDVCTCYIQEREERDRQKNIGSEKAPAWQCLCKRSMQRHEIHVTQVREARKRGSSEYARSNARHAAAAAGEEKCVPWCLRERERRHGENGSIRKSHEEE